MTAPRIGIVCGLKSEAAAVSAAIAAAPVDADHFMIGVSGASAARAAEIAKRFCEDGAAAVLSVGVSGGLDPALSPGDLIVTDKVHLRGAAPLQPASALAGNASFGGVRMGAPILGSDSIIQSADQKAKLHKDTDAIAVDMESHAVAQAAAQAGVPFLAIRAIADPADRALPAAAMNAVAPDGSTRVMKTLWEAVKSPSQFPALMKLGADSDNALNSLRAHLGKVLHAVLRQR